MAAEGIVDQNFISLMFVLLAAFLVPILLSRNSKVKLPIVVGEIIAGLILGPSVLDLVSLDGDVILFMRDFGLAFLMFIAGMEIDFNAQKSPAPASTSPSTRTLSSSAPPPSASPLRPRFSSPS